MNEEKLDAIRAARSGDREAAGRLVEQNAGLIWSVARRYFGRGADPDDLYQLGCVGFLKAVRGYDESFGTRFSTYAVPKISGEIRRFLRDDGTVKVSRGIKEQAAQLRQARTELEQRIGREPTVSELARETGMSVEDIAFVETATGPAESPAAGDGRGRLFTRAGAGRLRCGGAHGGACGAAGGDRKAARKGEAGGGAALLSRHDPAELRPGPARLTSADLPAGAPGGRAAAGTDELKQAAKHLLCRLNSLFYAMGLSKLLPCFSWRFMVESTL